MQLGVRIARAVQAVKDARIGKERVTNWLQGRRPGVVDEIFDLFAAARQPLLVWLPGCQARTSSHAHLIRKGYLT